MENLYMHLNHLCMKGFSCRKLSFIQILLSMRHSSNFFKKKKIIQSERNIWLHISINNELTNKCYVDLNIVVHALLIVILWFHAIHSLGGRVSVIPTPDRILFCRKKSCRNLWCSCSRGSHHVRRIMSRVEPLTSS